MCDLWVSNDTPLKPPALTGPRKWSDGEKLIVMCAVWKDNEYEANTVDCPVCHNVTLQYDQASIFDMSAWCHTCKTGIQQGRGGKATQKAN